MSNYIVKLGETIVDVCLNSTGSIINWNDILTANEFETWNPILTAGQVIVIPDTVIINQEVINELTQRPCNDNSYFDVSDQLGTLTDLLDAITDITGFYVEPSPTINTTNTYTVRAGETITDVCLNATGSIINWEKILIANDFTTWTPVLTAGQTIIIPIDCEFQTNVMVELKNKPCCNNSGINDLDVKIDYLIGQIMGAALSTEDGQILISEDGQNLMIE